jgi:hypothetical protein
MMLVTISVLMKFRDAFFCIIVGTGFTFQNLPSPQFLKKKERVEENKSWLLLKVYD